MQRLEVSVAVRPIYGSLDVKRLNVPKIMCLRGRGMAQAVSRCPFNAKTRFSSPVSPFKNRVGRRGTGTGSFFFFFKYFGIPLSVSFHQSSTVIFVYMMLLPGQAEVWENSESKPLPKIGDHWIGKYFLHFEFRRLNWYTAFQVKYRLIAQRLFICVSTVNRAAESGIGHL